MGDEEHFTMSEVVGFLVDKREVEREDVGEDEVIRGDLTERIRERAVEIIGRTVDGIYKLTLQGSLEGEFQSIDKREIRNVVNSLRDHPKITWAHDFRLCTKVDI